MFGLKARALSRARQDVLDAYDAAQRLRTACASRYDQALERKDTRAIHKAGCDLAEATTAALRLELER